MIRHRWAIVMAGSVWWAGCATPPPAPAPAPEPPPAPPVVEAVPVAPAPVAPAKAAKPAKPKGKSRAKGAAAEALPPATASAPVAAASAPAPEPAAPAPAVQPAPPTRGPAWLAACVTRREEGGVILCDADRLLAPPSAKVRVMTRDAALARNTAGGPITHRAGLPQRYRLFVVP